LKRHILTVKSDVSLNHVLPELLQSPERSNILSVWHWLEIAKTTVDRYIECLTGTKATA
jgi:hypothetical protein